jgi:pimeloyl-ACP methyl ester carboxylesterase
VTDHLIPLSETTHDDEVTVYVKGFLARGERPASFDHWMAGHRSLVETHDWSPYALGYHWESGQLRKLAVPVAGSAKALWDIYRLVRHTRRFAPLAAAGWFIAEQGVMITARFIGQFIEANREAVTRAEDLADCLETLALSHRRVRVVAHSLGCRQVIEAAALLPDEIRPHEIHLFAPACLEDEVSDKLPQLAREQAFVYFTRLDQVLEISFRAMSQGRAMGGAGLDRDYPGLLARDVSSEFDFWVHTEYKNRFGRFAEPATQRKSASTS